MKFCVVCAPGVGDLAILHIVSYHLKKMGHEVITVTPHRFGKWLKPYQFSNEIVPCDAIFLQHDNTEKSNAIRKNKNVYTFFGSYKISKHGPLKKDFDFVSNLNQTMVQNLAVSLKELFKIEATFENGFDPPAHLVHRRFTQRIAIHTTSGNSFRNWPERKFEKFAKWAEKQGLEPAFIPRFPTLEDLISFIYESGYFLGNDSGPGHIASYLKIPHLIIGKDKRHMMHWRPGWGYGAVITPPKWIPNWKGMRIRENHWSTFVSARHTIKTFKNIVLRNKFI